MCFMTRLLPLVLAAGVQVAAQTLERGFTSLFNGKDFTGWKIAGPADTFTIKDGAIVAKGPTSHCYLQEHPHQAAGLTSRFPYAEVTDVEPA